MTTDSDRDLGTSHLAKCERCKQAKQSYMLVRGLCSFCRDCRDELDAQATRTRAATEAKCPDLVDGLKAAAPGYDRAKHEAVAQRLLAEAMAKPRTPAAGRTVGSSFDGDGLEFKPSGVGFYVESNRQFAGIVTAFGLYAPDRTSHQFNAAQLRRIADVCERVKGGGA